MMFNPLTLQIHIPGTQLKNTSRHGHAIPVFGACDCPGSSTGNKNEEEEEAEEEVAGFPFLPSKSIPERGVPPKRKGHAHVQQLRYQSKQATGVQSHILEITLQIVAKGGSPPTKVK